MTRRNDTLKKRTEAFCLYDVSLINKKLRSIQIGALCVTRGYNDLTNMMIFIFEIMYDKIY